METGRVSIRSWVSGIHGNLQIFPGNLVYDQIKTNIKCRMRLFGPVVFYVDPNTYRVI